MQQQRIDDIVILRGFAILLVLICHIHSALIVWPMPAFDRLYLYIGGGSGVDLFFVISGFVIARSLYPELRVRAGSRSFAYISLAFWTRRVWRIFPSAWLWLVIILLATVKFNQSGAFHSYKAALDGSIAAFLQIHNYWFAKCFNHFDCGANFYYWSLSLEEQFYLLLPFTIFIFRRWFPHVLACLAVAQIFFPHRSMMFVAFRTDALLLGVLIALWSSKPSYRLFEQYFLSMSRWLRFFVIFCLLSVMMFDARSIEGNQVPFNYGISAVISAALVLISSFNRDYLSPPALLRKPLIWFGSRSCSLYLIHIPAFLFTQEIWYRIAAKGVVFDASYTLPFLLTGLGLLYLLGEGNYRFLESPSRKKGAEISARFLQKHLTVPTPASQESRTGV